MDKIQIIGGTPLEGTVSIGGAKNAALLMMACSLLTIEELALTNVPNLMDIHSMTLLLEQHGVAVTRNHEAHTLTLCADRISQTTAPYDLVRKMRASILVLGPLVARMGNAYVSLPGGCAIGARPVDFHLRGLEALGATITLEDGFIHAVAPPGGLRGGTYTFPRVSVTGTANLMMSACLAAGQTQILNAAAEPEVVDLAICLNQMGAQISGAGTEAIIIHGVSQLRGTQHKVIPDRIETGTYMLAAAITKGRLILKDTQTAFLSAFVAALQEAGIHIEETAEGIIVQAETEPTGVDVITGHFPGIATDMQAQMMALMCTARGASMITETIFENRFMHVSELQRMGAHITIHSPSALVRGVPHLTGAPVMATDLRASASLVLAGLAAQGETTVNRIYHLDRGYEKIETKLAACGAQIRRIQ